MEEKKYPHHEVNIHIRNAEELLVHDPHIVVTLQS